MQSNPVLRFITLARFLKNKTSTYRERKFIAALYAYPKQLTENLASLYHIHFFEFIRSGYTAITNKGYS